MSGLDFSKVDDKPLVNKSYNDNLDDKFAPRKAKEVAQELEDNVVIRKSAEKMKGWSLSEEMEYEVLQEYKDGILFRETTLLHPRVNTIRTYEDGKVQSAEYLLDGQFQLNPKEETTTLVNGTRVKNLYLYDGDTVIFQKVYYKNGTYREEFSVDKEHPLQSGKSRRTLDEGVDARVFNKDGSIGASRGIKKSLPYKPVQINFYGPPELNNLLVDFTKENGFKSKSEFILMLLSGEVDEETVELLHQQMEEQGIKDILKGN